MDAAVLNLYTYKPHHLVNGKLDPHSPIGTQGVLEAVNGDKTDKCACFLELKREQAHLITRLVEDFVHARSGEFYRSHVLLDALVWYDEYVSEFGDGGAFGRAVVQSCIDTVVSMYRLFATNGKLVVVWVREHDDRQHCVYVLLQHLAEQGIVRLSVSLL